MFRQDFQQLAVMRRREARLLFRARCFEGAYYLAGLGIECALKACIAKLTERFEFPPARQRIERIYSHNLDNLLTEAGLEPPPALEPSWAIVKDWKVDIRYSRGVSKPRAEGFLRAAYGRGGVMRWLRQCW